MRLEIRTLTGVLLLWSGMAEAQGPKVQVPQVVQNELVNIADQFRAVLEEECSEPRCYNIGCEIDRFDTIDRTQGSSLPGLDVEKPSEQVQYRLRSVTCTFSHEANFQDAALANLKQRLRARVRPGSVNLVVSSRALPPKPDATEALVPALPESLQPPDFSTALGNTLLPFIPWFLVGAMIALSMLSLLWGYRRLGVAKPAPVEATSESALALPSAPGNSDQVSPFTVMMKSDDLKKALSNDPQLTEATLKPLFEESNIEELCQIVRYFGPDLLQPFHGRPQYEKTLLTLSTAFDAKEQGDGSDFWEFLKRLERRLIAAKIRLDQQPLSEEFAFLSSLSLDELAGLIGNVSEAEAVLTLTYCTRAQREEFFASCPPKIVATYIERFATVDKLPDSYARETARHLRKIYEEEFSSLRTVQIHKVPLLESAINSLSANDRKILVSDLMRGNPDLIKTVGPHIVLDGSVTGLPDDMLTEAFLLVSPRAAAAYLATFDEQAAILSRLNPKLAETIRKQMRTLNGKFPTLVEEARDKIAIFIKEKDAAGAINLGAINSRLLSSGGTA